MSEPTKRCGPTSAGSEPSWVRLSPVSMAKSCSNLVEEVRGHTKAVRIEGDTEADDLLAALLEKLDLATTIDLVRAFSAYFYLANVAEQTHRVGDLAGTEGERYLDETIDRIQASRARTARSSPTSSRGSKSAPCSPPTRPRRPGARS